MARSGRAFRTGGRKGDGLTVSDAILVLNAGSSSIRFSLFAQADSGRHRVAGGKLEGLYTAPVFTATDAAGKELARQTWEDSPAFDHAQALAHILAFLASRLAQHRVRAVGHRVVHGGTDWYRPTRVDAALVERLAALAPLAPLHQPHNIAPMRHLLAVAPSLPQVACFDTAFHHDQPALAQALALPRDLTERGLRRYGFHGLSYESIAATLIRVDPAAAAGRTIVLHLGNGASMCALQAGRSIATTMGFSALDGLPMGTRCGSLDPGVLLYLMRELGMDVAALETLLYQRSGLLGVSGVSSDVRSLEASPAPEARAALDLFTYSIGRALGSLAAALGGVDALVFTAGIGENSRLVRAAVCRQAGWLGLEFDAEANAGHGPRISTAASRVAAWVVATDEEAVIAGHTQALLDGG